MFFSPLIKFCSERQYTVISHHAQQLCYIKLTKTEFASTESLPQDKYVHIDIHK